MTTLASPAHTTHVFIDRLFTTRSALTDTVFVLAGATTIGFLAQVSIPMWPVPITGQTLGVILVGAMLGARRGALSLALYALAGLAGVPWFANFGGGLAYALQPSFGFIIGFIATAWVVGRLSEKRWDRSTWKSMGAFAIASAIPFIVGVPWMWANLHFLSGKSLDLMATLNAGLIPFIPGGIVKWALAWAILTSAWKIAGSRR